MPTLHSTISFIVCWEWEKSVFGLMNCHAPGSLSERSSGPVSDLKLFIHIFLFPPFSLFEKELEGHPSEEEKVADGQPLQHSLLLGFYGLQHFTSWVFVPLVAVDLLKQNFISGFWEPQALDFHLYFEQVEIPSFLEVSKLPNSIYISEQKDQGFVGRGHCLFGRQSY